MSRRILYFDVLAVIAACLFVRLGVWQLHRLAERRARNTLISSRLQAAPVDATSLGGDTAAVHYRRVVVRGAPDYDHEMLLIERTRGGAPGVDLITPVHVPGHDSAVLVLRGWVYSPDGTTIAEQNYQESDGTFTGYMEELVGGATGGALPENPRFLRQMQQAAIAKVVPFPVFPFYVVVQGDSAITATGTTLERVDPPALDEGPHMSYAIQWFSFAAIALVGMGYVTVRSTKVEVPDWQATVGTR